MRALIKEIGMGRAEDRPRDRKILRDHGWTLERTVGSHRQYVHADNANVVTLPGAPGKQVATIRPASGIEELR